MLYLSATNAAVVGNPINLKVQSGGHHEDKYRKGINRIRFAAYGQKLRKEAHQSLTSHHRQVDGTQALIRKMVFACGHDSSLRRRQDQQAGRGTALLALPLLLWSSRQMAALHPSQAIQKRSLPGWYATGRSYRGERLLPGIAKLIAPASSSFLIVLSISK